MKFANGKRPAAFIDRDGTLIEEVNFLSKVEDLSIFPYTPEALSLLKEHGFLVVVVTNQSGIARSKYSESDMHAIHDAIQIQLDGMIDAFYFCPHLPDAGCVCRKPGLGMLQNAGQEFQIDLTRSWMIGDKKIDVETGINAGIRSAMVLTGYGMVQQNELERKPEVVAENILDAVNQIIQS